MPAVQGKVHRLYNPSNGDHMLTANSAEVTACKKAGWQDEGVIGTAPTYLAPIYRFLNVGTGEHLLTDNVAEAQSLLKQGTNLSDGTKAGWQYEGIAFIAYADDRGKEKITRLYQKGGLHILTSDANEIAALMKAGWTNEGVQYSLDAA